jgi:hypothetical protein
MILHHQKIGEIDNRCNVELTDTLRYDRWLETRWNIPTSSRINESLLILNRDDVLPQLNDRLHCAPRTSKYSKP